MSLLEKRLLAKNKKKSRQKITDDPIQPDNKLSAIQRNKRNIEIYLEEKDLPLLILKEISFSIFDKDTFSKKAVVNNIDNPNPNLNPYFSISDPRLGTIENWHACAHCNKTTEECTGHFGKINLGFNFIHPLYRSIVIMVLQSICHSCNKLLLKEPAIKEKGIKNKKGYTRLQEISKESEKIPCLNPNCGSKIKFETAEANEIKHRWVPYSVKKGNEVGPTKQMPVDTVLARLRAITDEDLKTLGFNNVHPKNFVMDYIPIIPITDRPPGITETDIKDHSLTYAYNDILSIFLESQHYISLDDKEGCYEKIMKIYFSLIVNKKNEPDTYTRNQQEAIQAIKDMINCKDGIIRNNLLGKRCDYTGRSVLGPNEDLNFGWLALTNHMKVITIPEIITHYNYKRIMKLAEEGSIIYICPKKGNLAGRKLGFDYQKHKDKISIGDKIERLTEDGDTLTFNRAPTLQPQSMLGFKIILQNKYSIGVHLSNTKGLNADFDGDEGNTHQIQTVDGQVEARIVMNTENNIISYSNSTPEAALVYNSIIGAFLLSNENVILTYEEFNKGLNYVLERVNSDYIKNNISTLENRLNEVPYLSGRSLISILFPPDFWYNDYNKEDNNNVFIGNGILRKGNLKERHVGSSNVSIISCLHKDYGKQTAVDFISASNFLFNWYIYRSGFTLSFKDITLREHSQTFINKRAEIIESSNAILEKISKNKPYTLIDIEEQKREIFQVFDNAGKKIQKETKEYLDTSNSIFIMIDSGAKGSISKAIEIVGSKTNISVQGGLPAKTLSENKRWLTTFSVDDYRLQSRGFSINSYYEGLDVNAYFAECQSGREGLIDTAVKTAKIGYLQRKMVKAQEDLIINYDGSIRNQMGVIFQYSYGPGFKTNEMVLDTSDDGFAVFSFINIKNLIGKINYKKGFRFDIQDEIKNIARKYGSTEEKNEKEEDIDSDNENKIYIAEADSDNDE
jgi:DNA-directed RNA polymerase beta' subunit